MSSYTVKDGTGKGYQAKIDSENRMWTFAVTEAEEMHTNRINGDAYMIYSAVTPTGAGDTFMYVKNTDTRDMVISWYRVWCDSAEAIDLYRGPTGTVSGGATATSVNMNFSSNKTASVTALGGVDLTGLSGGVLVDRLRISGDGKDVVDSYPGGIILPQGATLSAQVLNGALPIEVTFSFYYGKLGTT